MSNEKDENLAKNPRFRKSKIVSNDLIDRMIIVIN